MTTTDERMATLGQIADRARNLIDAHWQSIRDIADEPDDKGESGNVKFTLAVELSFRGKTPAGAVNISIPPRTIKDGCTFAVEDAEQEKLSLDDATVEIVSDGVTTGSTINEKLRRDAAERAVRDKARADRLAKQPCSKEAK